MLRIDHCPCCDSGSTESWPAVVAPFIAEFVLRKQVKTCKLLECKDCGFRFFDERFTDTEAERLYSRYRGPEYFEVRHRHEPWYTARFNENASAQSDTIVKRRQRMATFLENYVDPSKVHAVLDYGGDSGQAIPEEWGRERVVYDLSDAPPVPSVSKYSDEAMLPRQGFDLILLLHILEHVSDPAAVLCRVKPLLREQGFLFVEVPYERYSLRALGRGAMAGRYARWLARHPYALVAVDFVSTAARVKLGLVPPFAMAKLHEHINFFDERSLAAVAKRAGLEIVGMERQRFAAASDPFVLVALLRVTPV